MIPRKFLPSAPLVPKMRPEKEDLLPALTQTSSLIKPSEPSVDVLCELLKLQSAPEVSLDVFNGDPLEFHFFMSCFENVVEAKINDQKGKLILLIKYTSGEAKDLIKGCVHRDGNCYDYAKELLVTRFARREIPVSFSSKTISPKISGGCVGRKKVLKSAQEAFLKSLCGSAKYPIAVNSRINKETILYFQNISMVCLYGFRKSTN